MKVWVNGPSYSQPIYQATIADPMATVHVRRGPDEHYRIPDGAQPAEGTDRHMHVVDPSGRWVDEAWNMQRTDGGWTAGYHARVDLHGRGFGGGTRASQASAIGGLIRTWELAAGDIPHALAIAIASRQLSPAFVWPATRTDGNARHNPGPVPMGTYAAIPPDVDVMTLPLSPEGLAVAHAMQRYGVYVVDRSASVFTVYVEPDVSGVAITHIRADLETLRRFLRVVANNGPAAVNGGGARTVPRPPPFSR